MNVWTLTPDYRGAPVVFNWQGKELTGNVETDSVPVRTDTGLYLVPAHLLRPDPSGWPAEEEE